MVDLPVLGADTIANLQTIGNVGLGLLAAWLTKVSYSRHKAKAVEEPEEKENDFAIVAGSIADMRPVKDGVKMVTEVRADLKIIATHLEHTAVSAKSIADALKAAAEHQMKTSTILSDILVNQKQMLEFQEEIRDIQHKDAMEREIERRALVIASQSREQGHRERSRE